MDTQEKKTVQEADAPVVNMTVNPDKVDTDPNRERPRGREYPKSRSQMPEDQLFEFAEYNAMAAEKIGYSNYSYWGSTIRMFFKNKVAVSMLIVMGALLLFTFIQPILPNQFDPYYCNMWDDAYRAELYPNGDAPITAINGMPLKNLRPNKIFWFGTNSNGQDLWANIWQGTRNSLFIGFTTAIIEAIIGIMVGLLWGYVRWLDPILTEIYNVLNNIPSTIILILVSYVLSPSIGSVILSLSITGWIGMARFIRTQTLIIRDRDFNLASRCLGTPTRRVIFKNLLPHMVSVIMLRMALAIPGAIGSEAFLAYIGLGLPLDTPSLGNLANNGRKLMSTPQLRYQLLIPSAFLALITICFYLIGNAFADAADPRNHV